MSDTEITERLFQETMNAINSWVRSQGSNKMSPAEARGIAKAFLTQASMALACTLPGCDESDSRRLVEYFFEALKRFLEEKIEEMRDKLG